MKHSISLDLTKNTMNISVQPEVQNIWMSHFDRPQTGSFKISSSEPIVNQLRELSMNKYPLKVEFEIQHENII